MSHSKNILGAVALISMIGIAGAIGNDVGDYAAPEPDTATQRANLCKADGWPQDDNAKLAFERACRSELARRAI